MSTLERNRVQIGIAGLGGHGRTIVEAIERSDQYRVVAVFDPVLDERRRAEDLFGATGYHSFEEFLNAPVQAVVLVTPNTLHHAQTLAAFAKGYHVFVEKPLANSVEHGQEMVEAAQRAGRILMTGHNFRRGRAQRLAKKYIEEGKLGEIVSFELHFSANNIPLLAKNAWRLNPEACPLLPVMQLGIHGIDLVHALLGPVHQVTSRSRTVVAPEGVVDAVTALLELENGVHGTMICNYCTPISFTCHVYGTEGYVQCTPHRFTFRLNEDMDHGGEGPATVFDFSDKPRESFLFQMEAFAKAILDGSEVETDGVAGLQALAVAEAMQKSAGSKRTEKVWSTQR